MSISSGLNKQVGSNTLIKLVSELVGRVATFALVLGAARRLSEAEFGLYNYGLALGFVIAQIADLGLQVFIAREVAVADRQAKPLLLAALRLKLLLSLPVVVLLLLLTTGWPLSLRLSLLALGMALLVNTYLEFAAYVFRGRQQLIIEARLLASARLLTAVAGGVALLSGGGLMGLALTQLGSVVLLAGWSLWRLRQAGWLDSIAAIFTRSNGVLRRPSYSLLPQALPIGIAIFLSIAYTRLAILLLQYRLGEVAVAHFSAAFRLVEPSQILPASLVAAAFPAFTTLLHREPGEARQFGVRVSLLLAFSGVAVAFAFWFSAPWLMPLLYGEPFAVSTPVLQVLGLSAVPAFINYSLTHYLIARGQQTIMGVLTAVMLLLHAILSWQLIPRWGVLGPAVSIVTAETVLLCGCLLALALTNPQPASAQLHPEPLS